MTIRDLQRRAVDGIKRHALRLSLDSPRAQAHILTEYLWTEEGAETAALHRTRAANTPEWVDRLTANQLADELRHAALLRERLTDLGARTDRVPPGLIRLKLWWLERVTAPYMHAFEQGPTVVLLAIAAQLEGTGVRMFGRHLAVLEQHRAEDPTASVLRQILSDERRHAKSCTNAVERLVRDDERHTLDELREKIADVDRAFGITISCGFWIAVAAQAARDRAGTMRKRPSHARAGEQREPAVTDEIRMQPRVGETGVQSCVDETGAQSCADETGVQSCADEAGQPVPRAVTARAAGAR